MKEKAINGSIKKIALISIFLIFLVGIASADPVLSVDSVSANYYYSNYISANEDNLIKVVVSNSGPDPASDVTIDLSATNTTPSLVVDDFPIGDIAAGGSATVVLNDTTIRTSEGIVVYTAQASCSNGTSAQQDSAAINVRYNGYKGKTYWNGASNITTNATYDLNGGMVYYNQTDDAYAKTSWTTRTETWTSTQPEVPAGSTVVDARLYISYNWGSNTGVPDFGVNFNGNTAILNSMYGHYTDYSNIGTYGSKKYGLISVNVTSDYIPNGNNYLTMTRAGNNMALYPSNLVVVYANANESRKQIFINDNCDELLVNPTNYGTTEEEAVAYAPFTEQDISLRTVINATLYSFASSAGPAEGNLFFKDILEEDAWQGNQNSTCPVVLSIDKYNLTVTGNEAKIQGTQSGGMLAAEQILVVNY